MNSTNSLEQMVYEHTLIKRMLAVIRRVCLGILEGAEVAYEDFFQIIDFVRSFADGHHHGKEEQILFEKMMEELGSTAEKLVKLGMYVEHDLGRLFIQELEAAVHRVLEGDREARLDVIAHAVSYTHLLHRHIDKEDTVVFTYAERNLSREALQQVYEASAAFEREHEETAKQYTALLEALETKYSE